MEVAFSALLGEVVNQSVSFFIQKLSEETPSLSCDENLSRKLLRIRIIIEEAEGRQIRNPAMLDQLKVLRAGMYHGYYMLDRFKYRSYQDDIKDDGHGAVTVSNSFALSKFNPDKRIQLHMGQSSQEGKQELNQVFSYLELIITDASEFIMFLKRCPPLYRRPYDACLVLEKCVFGRYAETECIINFLMQKGSSGTKELDVLPIVGPAKAGKSTLVMHACNDERVRTAFSQIVFFTEDDLDERISAIGDSGTIKHQNQASHRDKMVLIIVDVNGDIHDNTWTRLYSTSERYTANGGKIILCSRSDKITRFGTARALKVEYLTREAYWYFFKTLAFGSMNPEQEPKLASMAMEISMGLYGSFITGNIVAGMLRANLNPKFWRMALSCAKDLQQRYPFIFGAHPFNPLQNKKLVQRLDGSNDYCLVFNDYQTISAQDEAPTITFHDVLLGNVDPHGKFDVVAWKSSIAPHYSYIVSCEIVKAPVLDVRKRAEPA